MVELCVTTQCTVRLNHWIFNRFRGFFFCCSPSLLFACCFFFSFFALFYYFCCFRRLLCLIDETAAITFLLNDSKIDLNWSVVGVQCLYIFFFFYCIALIESNQVRKSYKRIRLNIKRYDLPARTITLFHFDSVFCIFLIGQRENGTRDLIHGFSSSHLMYSNNLANAILLFFFYSHFKTEQ